MHVTLYGICMGRLGKLIYIPFALKLNPYMYTSFIDIFIIKWLYSLGKYNTFKNVIYQIWVLDRHLKADHTNEKRETHQSGMGTMKHTFYANVCTRMRRIDCMMRQVSRYHFFLWPYYTNVRARIVCIYSLLKFFIKIIYTVQCMWLNLPL